LSTEIAVTSYQQATLKIADLATRKSDWIAIERPRRVRYLQESVRGILSVAADWVAAACEHKGLEPNSNLAGEEWLVGPLATLLSLQELIRTLQANGNRQPLRWRTAVNQQAIADVFPSTIAQKLLWRGFKGEVWLQPGAPASQGSASRHPVGRLALVLGAGNISAIAPTDCLYKLFAENQVVLLKMNPVNAYIGPFLEVAFKSLIQDGFWQIVYGGAELGEFLCHHPEIDTVHITGSEATHDVIVWGSTSEERSQRQQAGQPKLTKPITSELGNVTPILVVPGPWSAADLEFQARNIAGTVAHNASFNCVASQVLVTSQDWPQRLPLLNQIRQALARTSNRKAYYPAAQQRYQAFLAHYPQAEVLTASAPDVVPWTMVTDLKPQPGEYALQTEAFCGVLAEVKLPTKDSGEFLEQAVAFVNQHVRGSLACMILVHPQTQRDFAEEWKWAIASLKYGNIGINVWPGANFSVAALPWGAFPAEDSIAKHPLIDIQSGLGVVHNAYLFDHPQKAVLQAPFRIFPKPAWFADHHNLRQLGRNLVNFEAAPTFGNFLKVVWAGLRG
jgi:acyl-CoA reductase-like NAD-dependent aldehyde dehydrogenase